ncbi:uncharacterized protein ACA1_038370 [Acanthamoeba castellanii str. Neff]|uniref:C3H1-type domain-containing protein n=1 Tax=Acanthamoeba castellanii (strain ATCC 30010 / Neff) TaxID=1257118 RepID=L8GKX2_ACACF|nr:uncharacterized protein ACA1_038370 [Acanthamoeba castellanii str. Neff]ELR13652.1 hypothetical protein ACA1_038370 [Acanthamoeba castellanii str. Neff]
MENKKTEDCYFFLNGYCSKGVKDRPICTNWLLEKCNDPDCTDRHPTLPRQKDGSRTLCFYNQACTRPDCPFFHVGTTASPATPRPDQESELTAGLTPREASKTTSITTSPTATISPVMKTAAGARLASGPVRPPRKRGTALPDLPPRDRVTAVGETGNGAKDSAAAPKQSFVKSFEEILKEKEDQEKGIKPSEPRQSRTEAVDNVRNKRAPATQQQQQPEKARPARSERPQLPQMSSQRTSTNDQAPRGGEANGRQRPARQQKNSAGSPSQAPAARPSFGVKSLDELMREGAIKQATASAAGAKEGGVKRPREESAATTKALPQPQQKQQKPEPVASTNEDDDFEKELEEIGIDDINGAAEPFDDAELDELLAE